jgi:hypothetical protein
MRSISLIFCALVLCVHSGCTRWGREPQARVELLRPAEPSAESVTLEIFFARIPPGNILLNDPTWHQIDEQPIASSVRRLLMLNGFRAGVVGGNIPANMARLLELVEAYPAQSELLQPVEPVHEPTVSRRWKQVRSGDPVQILASDLYDELPLLWHTGEHLGGRTLSQAQCIFALTPTVQTDSAVRFRLVPEVHYDQPQREFRSSEGFLHMHIARPKQAFDQLAIDVTLSAGQMLVISSLQDQSGSLGHHFLTRQTPQGLEQKLIVIRLAGTPPQQWFKEDHAAAGDSW